MIDIVYIQWLV